jgi:hypothetical protein
VLDVIEGRVLGALMEKQRTTPEQYPLSLNALRSACNQSSSRDPVMHLGEHEIEAALASLKERKLVRYVHPSHGRSVTRYRQVAEEVWGFEDDEYAVLCLLLLRGPQTPGEVRTRSDRLHGFADPVAVERALERLAAREEPMVRQLERQPGHREARWMQLVAVSAEPEGGAVIAGATGAEPAARRASLETAVAELRETVEGLSARVARLEAALDELL